jgi:hypothetical protein
MRELPDPSISPSAEDRWRAHGYDRTGWRESPESWVAHVESATGSLSQDSAARIHAKELSRRNGHTYVGLFQAEIKSGDRSVLTDITVKLEAADYLSAPAAREIADALLRGADLIDSMAVRA